MHPSTWAQGLLGTTARVPTCVRSAFRWVGFFWSSHQQSGRYKVIPKSENVKDRCWHLCRCTSARMGHWVFSGCIINPNSLTSTRSPARFPGLARLRCGGGPPPGTDAPPGPPVRLTNPQPGPTSPSTPSSLLFRFPPPLLTSPTPPPPQRASWVPPARAVICRPPHCWTCTHTHTS